MGLDQDPNLNGSDKVIVAISMTVIFALALLLVGGAFLFGFAGLFQLFSVQYETKGSLVYYILCLIPLTLLFEVGTFFIVIRVLTKVKRRWLGISSKVIITLLFIWIPLYLTDEIIKGISVPLHTEMVATLILFVVDSLVDKRHF